MDVELLRPGAVPISPETVLWFEFLLDPELLLKQLQKKNPDPSPTDLIKKFHEVIIDGVRNKSETEEVVNIDGSNEKHKDSAKSIALKILSLKVAAHLRWNIVHIRSLPLKTQINLLQDLMYFVNDNKYVEFPNIMDQNVATCNSQYLFALTLYHRWLLNTSMNKITSNWQTKYNFPDMGLLDENIICSQENINKAISFLIDSLGWDSVPDLLTYDCFKLLTDPYEYVEFDWTQSQSISKTEFCTQISFELGTFFFYQEQYDLAKEYFSKCRQNFNNLFSKNGFQDVDEKLLEIYINACHGSAEIQNGTLLEQLNMSIVNQYLGLTNILQQDNVRKEIPLIHRINLELDIQGALSSGAFTVARDLLQKIKVLNIIRCVLDKKPLNQYSSAFRNVDMLIWAIQSTWKSFSNIDKMLIKKFLMELIISEEIPELLQKLHSTDDIRLLFDKIDLNYIYNKESKLEIPDSLIKTEIIFEFNKKRKPKLEIRQLEKQLVLTNDHKEIREILVKIAMINTGTTIWTINPQWELPIPLQSVLKSLPRGFLQDYAYVNLAKSREQLACKNYNLSLEFLIILQKELEGSSNNVTKLFKLVRWEILLIQISQLLDSWPKSIIDKQALADACEACLQTNDSVLPRTEVVEHCAICLLNLGRWDFLSNLDKRRITFEITSAIAMSCQEIIKQKGTKKLPKNLWDIVLPIFAPLAQSKKGSAGFLESNTTRTNLESVFFKLKDTLCLGIVISLLAKLYNIFTDETSLEVQVEYVNLWPAVISNANSYNSTSVRELLSEMMSYALKEYPGNVSWLRLMGDISFANGHHKIALSYYLRSLLIFHDYFNIPIRNDDHVFRRMIRCCTTLGCHTQAAVLCQFLEETDYTLAFRILSDQKSCNDAVDAYYHCFWDTSILECLIYTHHKKGEYQRRKCAIQVIGMLELNSNNNEEIQREASNLRKSTFLRALCKQYVFENC